MGLHLPRIRGLMRWSKGRALTIMPCHKSQVHVMPDAVQKYERHLGAFYHNTHVRVLHPLCIEVSPAIAGRQSNGGVRTQGMVCATECLSQHVMTGIALTTCHMTTVRITRSILVLQVAGS